MDDSHLTLSTYHTMNEYQANRPVHAFWTANSVVDKVTGKAQEYSALKIGSESKKWIQGCSNEIGRLPRGVLPHIKSGSETIYFIHPNENPSDRRATHLRIVTELKPHRVHFNVRGDRINYRSTVTTPTIEVQTVTLHVNSVISTTRAKYMTMDIKNNYLSSPMNRWYQFTPLVVN